MARENNLVFNSTMSVEDFKASQNTKSIKVKELNAGSFSMLNDLNKVVGAVSARVNSQEGITKPVVSEVTDETGRTFFLLHQLGENSAKATIAEF